MVLHWLGRFGLSGCRFFFSYVSVMFSLLAGPCMELVFHVVWKRYRHL